MAKTSKTSKTAKAVKQGKTQIKLIHYVDPGHSWLRVPLRTLDKLGISALITPFSYQRTIYAYLEEDVDMTTFIRASEAAGKKVEFVTRNTNRQARIRNYEAYAPRNPVVAPASVATEVVETE